MEFYSHAVTGLSNPQSAFKDNTKEGFEYALSFKDLDGIEVDVQMSLDSTLWLFHDVHLEESTSGYGSICDKDDAYLNSVTFKDGSFLEKLSSVDLSNVQGSKKVILDIKYVGMCGNDLITVSSLINQVSNFIDHPLIHVQFIINTPQVAEQIHSVGFDVYQDALEKSDINVSSSVYKGWYIRNNNINTNEVIDAQNAGKEIIIYEVYSTGSIKKAIRKGPNALLIEDVKEAVILSD